MSRILRALVVSAVATSAAVFAAALLQNRDNLSLDKLTAGLSGKSDSTSSSDKADRPAGRARTGSGAPVDVLTDAEQEMLLSELQDHV